MHAKQTGFTLVEMAVVIIIIGILVGGLIKGREMIDNSRVNATAAQALSIRTAIRAFQDQYDQLPGDMVGGRERLPNCDSAMCNGNGDGQIGDAYLENHPRQVMLNGSQPLAERTLLWVHLKEAGYITGISNSVSRNAPLQFGETHPLSHFSTRGVVAGHFTLDHGNDEQEISLGMYIVTGNPATADWSHTLTRLQATNIARKLGDDMSSFDSVEGNFSWSGFSRATTGSCEEAGCTLQIRLR